MRATSEARGSSILKSMPPEEVQVKRSRGELSCAECRRCRIRCDRKVPCGSCVRRGCVSLCPNGSLRAGHGSRFVLADTEELHTRIAQMSQRIRQLEDALSTSHSGDSKDRHPLLREELLSLKFGSDLQQVKDEPEDEISLSFGTLTLTDSGGSKYFGASAGPLAALLGEEELLCGLDAQYPNTELPQGLSFLRAPGDAKQSLAEKLNALHACAPPRARALDLCEIYFEKYHFQPVERTELIDDIIHSVYDGNGVTLRPHKAAVLFMVFAVAALVDPALPPYSPEAETYCLMGMRALDLRCVSTSPDLETVMALALLGAYHGDSSKSRSLDTAWSSMSLAIKLAQKIGLHREPSRWNLDPTHAQRRRRLFWSLMVQDGTRSLALGRPPTMSLSWIDCHIPEENDTVDGILSTYKFYLTKDVMWPALELLQSTSPTNYGVVLDLDRRLRDLSMSSHLPTEEDCTTPASDMHWYLTTQSRYVVLLYIHRPFLALALLHHPENPLESPYAQSVMTAQSAASVMIRSLARQLEKHPATYMRFWSIWIYVFGAAVVAGSLVTRAPTMPSSALNDLDLALSLFEKGADHSRHAKLILPFIQQLKEKAYSAYTRSMGRNPPRPVQEKDDIASYPGQPPILSSKNLAKWSPRIPKRTELRSSETPPQTPPFIPFSQPGYQSGYSDSSYSQECGHATAYEHLHPPLRTPSFDYSASPSFPHSSPQIPHGLPMSGDLFAFHGDGSLFPGEVHHPTHPAINGQWLSLMQDSGIDFAH